MARQIVGAYLLWIMSPNETQFRKSIKIHILMSFIWSISWKCLVCPMIASLIIFININVKCMDFISVHG